MSKPNCNKCEKLFDEKEVKRVKGRNICGKCNYKKDKEIKDKKTEGVTGKICTKCTEFKLLSNFNTKGHKICIPCSPKKEFDFSKGIKCKKCENVVLTSENKVTDKICCKNCKNKQNQMYNKHILEKLENNSKKCEGCEKVLNIKLFKTPSHKKCKTCSPETPKITQEEYLRTHNETERCCLICKTVQPLATNFSYHTNNFRNQCKSCLNKFQRYVKYRENKIEEIGREAFRRHNTEKHREWTNENTEHLEEYNRIYTNSVNGICSVYYSSAKAKKLLEPNMTIKQFKEMIEILIKQDCYYCGRIAIEGSLEDFRAGDYNGVDRLNSNDTYNVNNCVPCCKHCNLIKKNMDIASFIRKSCEISVHNDINDVDINTDYRIKLHNTINLVGTSCSYIKYKYRADTKNIEFNLDKETFKKIAKSACYLCGKSGEMGLGIDRKDNTQGYTVDNCKPCCSYCNYMKNNIDYNVFLSKIKEIVAYTSNNGKVKELCLSSDFCPMFSSTNLPYENDTNDIYDMYEL